jgi:hypothetical protein
MSKLIKIPLNKDLTFEELLLELNSEAGTRDLSYLVSLTVAKRHTECRRRKKIIVRSCLISAIVRIVI